MEKIFENPSTFAEIASKIDGNFLSVANSLHRFAYPTHTVKGFAINDPDEAPTTGDAYVVSAAGTVWGLSVVANDVIYWNGTAWAKSPTNLVDIGNTVKTWASDQLNAVIGDIDTILDNINGEVL